MAEYEKKVREELKRHGKGDHDIWYSPITGVHVTVDGKIKSRYTAKAVMKQSGIDKRFQ